MLPVVSRHGLIVDASISAQPQQLVAWHYPVQGPRLFLKLGFHGGRYRMLQDLPTFTIKQTTDGETHPWSNMSYLFWECHFTIFYRIDEIIESKLNNEVMQFL